MKLQGRKFFGMIIGLIVINALIVTGFLFAPASIDSTVLVFAISANTFLITAYIGGNVFNTWAKSKHFHNELKNEA